MKLSVILTVYNDEKFIKESVQSVLDQTFTDFELLIGFNGTIDNSKEVLSKFSDNRIKIFDYGNEKGRSKTLNKLLKESSGEWIAIQDGDDVWLPKKLEKQFELADSSGVDVVGTNIFYCDKKGVVTGSPVLEIDHDKIVSKSKMGLNQIANSSSLFSRSAAIDVDGWDEGCIGIEDFDFWLKLMRKGYKFSNVKKNLVLHRIHSESSFNTKTFDIKALLKKHNINV